MKTQKICIGLAVIVTAHLGLSAPSVYNLYTDHRAMRVDDILTVYVVESAKAGSQSNTSTSKQNDFGLSGSGGSGAIGFIPAFGVSAGNSISYDGKGGTSREGSLVAKISARVIEVMDNGNLVIKGSKQVEINNEKEIIKISGVVRPQDIESDNTIYSHNIADASITYSGKGNASTGRRPGLLARFLNWIF
jgi:flagellar L-ring protein precursor FlgH